MLVGIEESFFFSSIIGRLFRYQPVAKKRAKKGSTEFSNLSNATDLSISAEKPYMSKAQLLIDYILNRI